MFALRSLTRMNNVNLTIVILSLQKCCRNVAGAMHFSTPALKVPPPEGLSCEETDHSPKIKNLVSLISNLTLVEASQLSSLLRQQLNLPDAPIVSMGAPGAAAAGEEDAAPKQVQTSFTVKLVKFDDKRKIALIKEVKALVEGMNLVQAKKFVESVPAVLKADISKDEAEKMKEAITKAGGECEIS